MSQRRILYLLKLLSEETDAVHGITLHKIYDLLAQNYPEFDCSEQRVRHDLELISDVCCNGGCNAFLPLRFERRSGPHNEYEYHLYNPDFGLEDAKLLFDPVSNNQFLSMSKKRSLIGQMEGLLSTRQVQQLVHNLPIPPVLPLSDTLIDAINMIDDALMRQSCLRFDYVKYDVDGKPGRGISHRHIRPITTVCRMDHYYLIALNPSHPPKDRQRTYRIDRMRSVALDSGEWLRSDPERTQAGQFDMFTPEAKMVVILRVHPDLMDMVVEQLSPIHSCHADEDGWARVTASVEISHGFDRWVLKQAGKIQVLAPPMIQTRITNILQKMMDSYHK